MKNYMMNTKKRFMPLLTVLLIVCLALNAAAPLTVLAESAEPEATEEPVEDDSDVGGTKESNTGTKSENTYDATIHYISGSSSSGYTEQIYKYSGSDPLLVLYNRSTMYNSYLKAYGSSNVLFYTFSDDGASAVFPKVTYVKSIKHNLTTDEITETEYNTEQTLSSLNNSRTCSVYIEGEYETLAYSPTRFVDGEAVNIGLKDSEVAYYYLKRGETLSGWRAFSFDFTSRAVFDCDYYTLSDKADINIMEVELADGVLSHGGTIYSDDDVYRGGMRIKFCYYSTCGNYSLNVYYNYSLLLDADKYELNFADIKSLTIGARTYELDRIYFTPVVQYDVTCPTLWGNDIVFYTEELEEAGCFEEGGDPIIVYGSSDKSGESDSNYTGDPSEKDNGDGQSPGDSMDEDEGQTKVYPEAPTEPEWDETEHSFWENTLHYLKYFADNMYNLVLSLVGFPEFITDMLESSDGIGDFFSSFFDELTSSFTGLFVPEEDFTDKYIQVFNDSFPVVASSKQFMADFMERLKELGNTAPSLTIPFSKIWQGRAAMYDAEMSFAWFEPYRKDFHTLVSGIMWAVFCYRQYMGIKNMLNATGGVVSMFGSGGAD